MPRRTGSVGILKLERQGKEFQVYFSESMHRKTADRKFKDLHLQDLLELTPSKDVLFIKGDWNAN